MAVHHVEMDPVDAGALELAHDAIEIAEVGGQDAGRDGDLARHLPAGRASASALCTTSS
jgi:hypothetical protein